MTVAEILKQAGEREDLALKEYATLLALSKISRYEVECSLFEAKYREPLAQFQRHVQSLQDQEDFAVEDDLMDWEFADRALRWWQERLTEIDKC